jgi:hypothetical protein
MVGTDPSAAPGLEDGQGPAAIGAPLFVFADLSFADLSIL